MKEAKGMAQGHTKARSSTSPVVLVKGRVGANLAQSVSKMDCEYEHCHKIGLYQYDGKWYCPKHYSIVINREKPDIVTDRKPLPPQ
jgi:hypothetical protein